MAIDVRKTPFLFSAGTLLAYKIAKRYYHDVHYVWCTDQFHSKTQPATSDPQSIIYRYLKSIEGDRHAVEISDNIAGILRGADAKKEDGVIDEKTHELICQMVNCADYEAFFPVLFIINSRAVKDKCIPVPKEECARDDSVEYKIVNLKDNEFQLIDFRSFLMDFIDVADAAIVRS